LKLKCNKNYIELGRLKVRFKDISKIIYSESNGNTCIHIFNYETEKHIGRASVPTESAKDFLAALAGYTSRYKIPFVREENDSYAEVPVENYVPVPLDTFEKRKRIVGILGWILLFIVCAVLSLLLVHTDYVTMISSIAVGVLLMFALIRLSSKKKIKILLGIAGFIAGTYLYSMFFNNIDAIASIPATVMFLAVFLPPGAALFMLLRSLVD